MRCGLLLDNVPIGERVPEESIGKLATMRASCVGTLWTGGTHHEREVYERCEVVLDKPLYIVRVGGHRQTAAEWRRDANAGEWEVPSGANGWAVLTFGNEPNLEGWADYPEEYGRVYAEVRADAEWGFGCPVAFAVPSVGVLGWGDWLQKALWAAGYRGGPRVPAMVANLYAGNLGLAKQLRGLCERLYIGEVNDLGWRGEARRGWLEGAFDRLARAGAEAACVFIAGGKSNGAWDERYMVTAEEVAGLGAGPHPDPLPQEGEGTEAAASPGGDLRPVDVVAGDRRSGLGDAGDRTLTGTCGRSPLRNEGEDGMDAEVRARVLRWAHLFGPLATSAGVRVSLVAGLIAVESGGDERARSPMNYVDGHPIGRAQGLMQVLPGHFGLAVGEDGELALAQERYCRQPGRNAGVGVVLLSGWVDEVKALAAYFGALDDDGGPGDGTDVTGTSGKRYVELVLGAAEEFRFLDEVPWGELGGATMTADLTLEQCQYGEAWPEVGANLLGVANDALETGRAVRDAVLAGVNLWGTR